MSRRAGFTLIEITVWCFLAILFLMALWSLYVTGWSMYQESSGSYMIGQESEAGIRFLRGDLQETALASIRVFPNPQDAAEKQPGMSMASARSYDNPNRFLVSEHGVPEWNKHVFYTLDPTGERTGALVRWEIPDGDAVKSPIPAVSTVMPSDSRKDQTKSYKRVVVRNVLLPGKKIEGMGASGSYTADAQYGGFRVAFVRQDPTLPEVLSPWNPVDVTSGKAGDVPLPRGNTRVLEVRLEGLMTSDTSSKPSFYSVHFRIAPRH